MTMIRTVNRESLAMAEFPPEPNLASGAREDSNYRCGAPGLAGGRTLLETSDHVSSRLVALLRQEPVPAALYLRGGPRRAVSCGRVECVGRALPVNDLGPAVIFWWAMPTLRAFPDSEGDSPIFPAGKSGQSPSTTLGICRQCLP